MITWMKNMNNFPTAKVQSQGVAQHLLHFFANFSMKVLVITLQKLNKIKLSG